MKGINLSMKKLVLVSILSLISTFFFMGIADCQQFTGQSFYTGPETPEIAWTFHGQINFSSLPVVGNDGVIYGGSLYGYLYAINPDGSEKWRLYIGDSIKYSPVVSDDGTIYVNSTSLYYSDMYGYLNAVNPDGTLKWRYKVELWLSTPPVLGTDGSIFFGTEKGDLYAINADGSLKWLFSEGIEPASVPVIGNDGTIYLCLYEEGHAGYLYAINMDGTIKWRFQADEDSEVSSVGLSDDGFIYFISGHGIPMSFGYVSNLYALNPNGEMQWKSESLWSIIATPPVIGTDGTIYIGMNDSGDMMPLGGSLVAFNPDGSIKWDVHLGGSVVANPFESDGKIYIHASVSDYNNEVYGTHLYIVNHDGTINSDILTDGILFIGADGTIYLNTDLDFLAWDRTWNLKFRIKKAGGTFKSTPTMGDDGTLYVGSEDQLLYALNGDGTEKWRFETESQIHTTPAIGKDGTIYLGTGINLYAINPNGNLKWKLESSEPNSNSYFSSPAIGEDGTIYVCSLYYFGKNYLYAVNSDGTEKWKLEVEELDSYPVVGKDDTIFIIAGEGLLAINPDGTQKWEYVIEDFRWGAAYLNTGADGTIFAVIHTSYNIDNYHYDAGYVFAINPDGSEIWRYKNEHGFFRTTPTIGADGTVYVGSSDDSLHAINPDGSAKWQFKTDLDIYASPVIDSDGIIYVGSRDKYLYAVFPDGTQKWRIKTPGFIEISPVLSSDGTIYVGSTFGDRGWIYAIKETQNIHLNLEIKPVQLNYSDGDSLKLFLDIKAPILSVTGDLYFVMINPENEMLFGMSWARNQAPAIANFTFNANFSLSKFPIVDITMPSENPPVKIPGRYTFGVAVTKAGTFDLISNIGMVRFTLE